MTRTNKEAAFLSPMPSHLPTPQILALDLDGVVYNGNAACAGAPEAVAYARQQGYRVFFTTNNSARTRAELAAKLQRLSIPADENEVLTSATAMGLLLRRLAPTGRPLTILPLGTPGMQTEIASHYPEVQFVRPGVPCEAVVIGFLDDFSYWHIQAGLDAILSGACFLACNLDPHFPDQTGRRLPGCGAMAGAIAGACGRPPDHVAGKPQTIMLEWIQSQTGCAPQDILVIGDSPDADVSMGRRFGSPTLLVGEAPAAPDAGARLPAGLMQLPRWLQHLPTSCPP